MDVGAPFRRTAPASGLAAIAGRVATTRVVLGAIVSLSALLHAALAWRRPTPGYFPDEYMYAELGRSLAETGTPLVRGELAGFLPLLYPVLTAPAWLIDDVELGYRAVQGINAVAMSLAAIPVYLLARRLRVGNGLALAAAALAVVLPELMYTSAVTAEPLAYPLALAAAAAAVAALERPLLRYQVAFLGFAGLATLARLQLVVLPLCYAAAVLLVGARGRRPRALLREQRLAAGSLGAGLVLVLGAVVALGGQLGLYGELLAYRVEPVVALKGLGVTALVLAYSVGWVLVPAALLGLWLAVARPRSIAESAFGAFAISFVLLLLVQAAAFGDAGRVQERYAIYALPLVVVALMLFASRGWPFLRAQLGLAAALAAAAAAVPLAGYAAGGGTAQSFVLVSVARLERLLGDVGLASLAVAAGATAASGLVLAAAALRPRLATAAAIGVTAVAAVAISAATFSYYQDSRGALRDAVLPRDASWVDAAADGPVTLLLGSRFSRADMSTTLFWNRSVDRLAVLRSGEKPDPFTVLRPRVDRAGRLDLPPGRLVLADTYGGWLSFRSAERVAAGPTKMLWRPEAAPQLALVLTGRYYSGLLASEGAMRAWPAAPGERLSAWLELELVAPAAAGGPVPIEVELPGKRVLRRSIRRGAPQLLRIPVCSAGPWKATFRTASVALVQGARVGLVAPSEPRLVDARAACP